MPFDDATLRSWVDQTSAAAAIEGDTYIRILLTRGIGDLTYDVRATPAPSIVIVVKPQEAPDPRVRADGIPIALVPILRNHPGSVNPIIKSNNLLNNALAMQEAHRRGGEEALMCNYRGELSECSQSNVFLIRDGVALTPRSQAGLLEGITRAFLFEVGQEIGVEVKDATLMPADLGTADEIFITSTTREISPVVRVDDRVIGRGRPGPITLQLWDAYHRRALEMTSAAAARAPCAERHVARDLNGRAANQLSTPSFQLTSSGNASQIGSLGTLGFGSWELTMAFSAHC